MKTISFAMVEGCAVAVFARIAPAPVDFDAYLKFAVNDVLTMQRQRLLIVSHGGTPTNDQRRRIEQVSAATADRRRIAMLTPSTFVRGIVRAMSVFDRSYRVFDLPEMEAGLRHLEIPEWAWPRVKETVDRLSTETGA